MATPRQEFTDAQKLGEALRLAQLADAEVETVRQIFERRGLGAALAAINERTRRMHPIDNRRRDR
jgi:hypothetical protein